MVCLGWGLGRHSWGEVMGAKIKLTDAELVVVLERAAANLEAGGDKKGARSVRQAAKILRKEEAARGERRRVKKKQ
jgi:hypothetical protein